MRYKCNNNLWVFLLNEGQGNLVINQRNVGNYFNQFIEKLLRLNFLI